MRRWLRNTALLVALAVTAVVVVKLAQPYLVAIPQETGAPAGE